MEVALSAKTTVTLRDGQKKDFRASAQMHSEIRAIQWMIGERPLGTPGRRMMWISDGSTQAQFSTTEPHCGFCTIYEQIMLANKERQ